MIYLADMPPYRSFCLLARYTERLIVILVFQAMNAVSNLYAWLKMIYISDIVGWQAHPTDVFVTYRMVELYTAYALHCTGRVISIEA